MFQNGAGPAIMRSSPVAVRRVARVGAAGAPIASSPTSRSGGARGVRKGKGKASLWDEPTTTSRTSLTKLGGAGDGTGTRTSVLSSAALQQHYSAAFGIGDLNGGAYSTYTHTYTHSYFIRYYFMAYHVTFLQFYVCYIYGAPPLFFYVQQSSRCVCKVAQPAVFTVFFFHLLLFFLPNTELGVIYIYIILMVPAPTAATSFRNATITLPQFV